MALNDVKHFCGWYLVRDIGAILMYHYIVTQFHVKNKPETLMNVSLEHDIRHHTKAKGHAFTNSSLPALEHNNIRKDSKRCMA